MRSIKFRAWDKSGRGANPEPAVFEVAKIDFEKEILWLKRLSIARHLDEVELMQFTGLLDKNGKEIYEGDIVTVFTPSGEIAYNEPIKDIIYAHKLSGVGDDYGSCKVIGNIYENPELTSH